MITNSLGFIGGGRITKIFLQAFGRKEQEFEKVMVFETNSETIKALKQQFPWIEVAESIREAAKQSVVFLALHPPMIMEALDQIREAMDPEACVISLAPKITIEKISARLKTRKIVRMIPNATSFINEGYNPVTFARDFNEREKESLLELLNLLGTTFEVAEDKLEGYALLSAMLPTYFWFQWDELCKMGKQMGLTEAETKASLDHTLIAAIKLLFHSGLTPDQVMDLIPVKPIGENEGQVKDIYQEKLMGLFSKIKP